MSYLCFFAVTILIIFLDQTTKLLITSTLILNDSIELIPGLLHIVYIRNPGVAFGFLKGIPKYIRTPSLIVFSLFAIAIVFFLYYRGSKTNRLEDLALSFILGGAMGNLVDRVRFGEVIDFIDIHMGRYHWPAFNIADSAITLGVGLFILNIAFPSISRRQGI